MAKARCMICAHPCREQIEQAIYKRTPDTAITAHYGNVFNVSTLASHRRECIKHAIVAAEAAIRVDRGIDVKEIVLENNSIFQRAKRACVRWLADVDNPEEFDLDPRATEIDIIYYDLGDLNKKGKPVRKKAPLQELLNKVEVGANYVVKSHYDKSIDIRRYVLEVLHEERGDLEFYAKLAGLLQKDRENEFDERAKFEKELERVMADGWDRENAIAIVKAADTTGRAEIFLHDA